MKSRSELRDVIVTVTYQSYIMEVANLKFSIDKLIEEQPDIYKNEEFVIETCKGIYKNQKKISEMANKYLNNWTIDDSAGYSGDQIDDSVNDDFDFT